MVLRSVTGTAVSTVIRSQVMTSPCFTYLYDLINIFLANCILTVSMLVKFFISKYVLVSLTL